MAALSKKNLEDFDKQSQGKGSSITTVTNRRASIISRRSSVSGSTGVPVNKFGRRLSRAFTSGIGGIGIKSAISTNTSLSPSKPRVQYENTYKIQPGPDTRFLPGKFEHILQQILDNNLDGVRYEPRNAAILASRISEEIKFRVKDLKIPRYKIIAQLFIGAKEEHCMQMVSRSLWDTETDNFVSRSYQNESLFAVATVHCTYFE